MTLVDVLVGIFLISLIFVGILGAFQLGFKVMRLSQKKFVAMNLGQGKIEEASNLPYEDLGTVGASLPYAEGVISPSETFVRNNKEYEVETRVKYIVDETDGVSSPEDECPNDYKKVEVKVSWGGFAGGDLKFIIDVSPPTLAEECSQAGGVLGVSTFNASGEMVSSPLIEVLDPDTEELVDSATPFEGEYFFILSPDTYKVVVSKEDYSSSRTYGDDEVAEPIKPHPMIIEKERVELGFAIDEVADFSVDTLTTVQTEEGEEVVPAPEIEFSLRGEKTIGDDEEGNSVYKYEESFVSDGNGQVTISDIEWDSYTFSIDPNKEYILEEVDPSPQPVELAPGTTKEVDLYIAFENTLFVKVKEAETEDPVFSAEVTLSNGDLGYLETQRTDEDGETYFLPLEDGEYVLEVDAQDYNSYSGQVTISGNTSEVVELERVE